MNAEDVLRAAGSVLLIDWPSRDVPDTVARAGYAVTVKGGPDSYAVYEIVGDDVLRTPCPKPSAVDVVYVHRPVEELPGILTLAAALGCQAVWVQTPDPRARLLVEAAGMAYGEGSIVEALTA
jgi:predicted CoA-binding protein